MLGEINDEQVASYIQDIDSLLEAIEELELNSKILSEASKPFLVSIKTLDALHLATALILQEFFAQEIIFYTYDNQLSRAALVSGLKISSI